MAPFTVATVVDHCVVCQTTNVDKAAIFDFIAVVDSALGVAGTDRRGAARSAKPQAESLARQYAATFAHAPVIMVHFKLGQHFSRLMGDITRILASRCESIGMGQSVP